MELENRYIVIKTEDYKNYLEEDQRQDIADALAVIALRRANDGRPWLTTLVIEEDWPEYEPTKKALEDRIQVDAWNTKVRKRDYMLEYARGMDEAAAYLQGNGQIDMLRGIGAFCNGWNDFVKKWLAQ